MLWKAIVKEEAVRTNRNFMRLKRMRSLRDDGELFLKINLQKLKTQWCYDLKNFRVDEDRMFLKYMRLEWREPRR